MHSPVYGHNFFKNLGVIKEGHFKLRSGNHSDQYIEKEKIFEIPFEYWEIIENLALRAKSYSPEVIAGPQSGGAKIARSLAKEMNITYVELEKCENDYDFQVPPEKQSEVSDKIVVVVDDVLTTGGSLRGSIGAVQKSGGKVVSALVIIDRSTKQIDLDVGVRYNALCYIELAQWKKDDCYLCAALIPFTPKPQTNPS